MPQKMYFLGIDGGGTGCRAVVTRADGMRLGAGAAGPASLRLGASTVMAALNDAARAALDAAGVQASSVTIHAAAGLAGTSRTDILRQLQATPHPFASLTIVADAYTACLGAHGGHDGGVVIAGTGSIGFAIVGAREVQVGGHGFPMSDAGSGAAIGLQAVRGSLRAFDGLIPMAPLWTAVLARFGADPAAMVRWQDTASATDYAALAPVVADCARTGDLAAVELLEAAARDLTEFASALFARGAPRVALLGGLAPVIAPWLTEAARARLSVPLGDGIDGALLVARRAAAA